MAPLAKDKCGNPLDFSPLDFEADGGNMVLWDNVKGGAFPWDPNYFTAEPDLSSGFDPTYIMQHATDSASTAACLATGHKSAVNMMSVDLYEEKVSTLVEDAMFCGKAGGVVTSVQMLHATPGAFISHANYRKARKTLQHQFTHVNPTMASGVCSGGYWPESSFESMKSGKMSSEWTVLTQDENITSAEFYKAMEGLDPDDGDHVLVCLGGDFNPSGGSNMPFRGLDSSYSNRWCSGGEEIVNDAGSVTGYTSKSEMCDHYSEEDRQHIPKMVDQVKATLDFLSKDDDGFFMMYEQGDVSGSRQ